MSGFQRNILLLFMVIFCSVVMSCSAQDEGGTNDGGASDAKPEGDVPENTNPEDPPQDNANLNPGCSNAEARKLIEENAKETALEEGPDISADNFQNAKGDVAVEVYDKLDDANEDGQIEECLQLYLAIYKSTLKSQGLTDAEIDAFVNKVNVQQK